MRKEGKRATKARAPLPSLPLPQPRPPLPELRRLRAWLLPVIAYCSCCTNPSQCLDAHAAGAFTSKLAENFSSFAKSFVSDSPDDQEAVVEEEEELDKVKNDSSETQKKRKEALHARLRNVAVQICFAITLFIAVWSPYYSRNGQDWQAVDAIHQYVSRPFDTADVNTAAAGNTTANVSTSSASPATTVQAVPLFDNIGSVDHLWLWLENTMLDMMFPAKMYPGGAPGKFLGVGHVINAVRFHQKRVNKGTCNSLDPNLDQVVAGADCHAALTPETEHKATWGPFNKFRFSLGSGVQTVYQGRLASYDMAGYYTDSVATRSDAIEIIADLKEVDWIDLQTRAIFVDFAVFYPSANGFVSARFAFEFSPSGGVFTSMDIQPLALYIFTSMPALIVIEIVVVALQGYFFLQVKQSILVFVFKVLCTVFLIAA
jgi:hypothetical protein